ncbi:MAG: hypothetical protein ACYS0F_10675, partial [Planctomycetota bacterium]
MPNGEEAPGTNRLERRFDSVRNQITVLIVLASVAMGVALWAALQDDGDGPVTTVNPHNENTVHVEPIHVEPLATWPNVWCPYDVGGVSYTKLAADLIADIESDLIAEIGATDPSDTTKLAQLMHVWNLLQQYGLPPALGSTDAALHAQWCTKLWKAYLRVIDPATGNPIGTPDWI